MSHQTTRGGPPLLVLAMALLGAGACTDRAPSPLAAPGEASLAARGGAANRIPGQYVVVLAPEARDVPGLVRGLSRSPHDSVLYVYEHALKGFNARLAPASVEALRRHPMVLEITEDEYGVPDQSLWSLDRTDQRDLPLNGVFSPAATGAGVNVYVIDSGIRRTHAEFGNRVRHSYTAIYDGLGAEDCVGHGTHVAATAAGASYGAARAATVHALRIADCGGAATAGAAIAALDWLRAYHAKPAVANLSYTWPARSDLDAAVSSVLNAGVPVVTSAGNSNADACGYSPKRVSGVVTVGASDGQDRRVYDSNWGSCVHLFAPGAGITSAWSGSDSDARTLSGTSMASPLVAGIMALYLQQDPYAPVWKVRDAVLGSATQGRIVDPQGAANRLAYALPVYFAVTAWGPASIGTTGYHTWEAQPTGGDGSYAYQWSVYWHARGLVEPLGTGRTQSVYVGVGEGDFEMRVTAVSAGNTQTASVSVSNPAGSGCSGSGCGTGPFTRW